MFIVFIYFFAAVSAHKGYTQLVDKIKEPGLLRNLSPPTSMFKLLSNQTMHVRIWKYDMSAVVESKGYKFRYDPSRHGKASLIEIESCGDIWIKEYQLFDEDDPDEMMHQIVDVLVSCLTLVCMVYYMSAISKNRTVAVLFGLLEMMNNDVGGLLTKFHINSLRLK